MNKFFLERPIFSIVISIMIVIIGLISIKGLPIEQYPNITPPVVQVNASYTGADANVVSQSVATPIAQSVMGVDNMLYMQSTSANDGSMNLSVVFDVGADPNLSTIYTQNRVATALSQLPQEVQELGVTTRAAMEDFMMVIALYSDGRYSDEFISNYATLNIQNRLLKLNGVGNVQVMGSGNYSMRVWLKPDKLASLNLSVEDVAAAIESQSGVFPSGKFGAEPTEAHSDFTYTVVLPPEISTAEEYKNIVLLTLENGSEVKLSDVAKVEFGSQSYDVVSKFGKAPAAIVAVYQSAGSNALDVGNSIKEQFKEIGEIMPPGMEYDVVVDTTLVISEGIEEILFTLAMALLLVVLIIYLFIQDIRAMIIPLVAIPVSLIGAFMLFPLLGFSINVFSLLGLVLAIGLVVDDAIVVVEAVQIAIERGATPKEATVQAMRVVSPAIIATTAILAAVFIPVSFMGGITGLLYQQFAITIALSVLISAFNALTLSPVLCSLYLRGSKPKERGFFGWFNRKFKRGVEGYSSTVAVFSRKLARSILIVIVLGGAVVALFKYTPIGFLPEEDQGFLMTMVTLPAASSLDRTEEVMDEIVSILQKESFTDGVASASGFNFMANIASTNSGIIFIKLTDRDKRQDASAIARELNELLYFEVNRASCYTLGPPAIPGIGNASGFSLMVQNSDGTATNKEMEDITNTFLEKANKRAEIATAFTEYSASIPQRKLSIDKAAAFEAGVSISDIHTEIAAFLGGLYVNNFNRFGRLYQTYIGAEYQYRENADGLENFFVENKRGVAVPLSSFVSVSDTTGVAYLTGFNLLKSVAIMGNAASGYSSSQAMEALKEVADETLPQGFEMAWSGMSLQESVASSGAIYTYLSAIIFIFLVLAALYNSWSLPFSILLGVPFALFGALLFNFIALHFSSIYVDNIFMQISLIMLIGLSAKNAILIVQFAQDRFLSGKTVVEAAMEAAKLRVRPIIMTAMAFILGVMPLVFASGANSQARNVMGIALVGGMAVATVLGVIIYPSLYILFCKIVHLEEKRDKSIDKR